MAKQRLNENDDLFVTKDASDGQSGIPDPIAKDSSRSADKSGGEKAIPTFVTKVEALNAVMQELSGLPKEKIGDIFKGLTDGLSAEKSRATRRIGGTAKDSTEGETVEQSRRSPTSVSGIAKEDMDVIFGGEELSEEVREKAKTIFEAAVNSRLVTEIARIEEEFETALLEALEEKVDMLSENVNKYLSYALEQWVEENKIAIESGLKAEVVEGFILGLKGLFEENYVEIPDDKVDLVAELSQHITELEEKVNSVVQENFELKDYVDTLEVEKVFAEAVESLPLTQADKLRSLVEGVEYSNVEEFTKKLNTIKETYFAPEAKKITASQQLTEATDYDDDAEEVKTSGVMSIYANAISKTTKK